MQKKRRHIGDRFEALSETITRWTGSTTAFASAIGVVVLWAVVGPLFRYSDTWQLVINTGTTVVTFMMVFLIQRAQNKDALAIHMKLNELVAALEGASNRLIEVEDLTEADLKVLQTHYRELARLAAEEAEVGHSHSVEEARHRHTRKLQGSGIRDNNQGSGIRDKGSE